jgi:hypothetical protein
MPLDLIAERGALSFLSRLSDPSWLKALETDGVTEMRRPAQLLLLSGLDVRAEPHAELSF